VLINPTHQVVGHADVQNVTVFIGEAIDEIHGHAMGRFLPSVEMTEEVRPLKAVGSAPMPSRTCGEGFHAPVRKNGAWNAPSTLEISARRAQRQVCNIEDIDRE
jgi:hypothetical protein